MKTTIDLVTVLTVKINCLKQLFNTIIESFLFDASFSNWEHSNNGHPLSFKHRIYLDLSWVPLLINIITVEIYHY